MVAGVTPKAAQTLEGGRLNNSQQKLRLPLTRLNSEVNVLDSC
jgi:hypothetical protein